MKWKKMKRRDENRQVDEIIKEETDVLWWIRRDLTDLSVETLEGTGLSLTPTQEEGWQENINERIRAIAHFLKIHSNLLPTNDKILAVITYKKLNNLLWETKESTSQYAKEKIEITDILTDIPKALLLVNNKTPTLDGYGTDISTVRDEAIFVLSSLVTAGDKKDYLQEIVDIFLDVIENRRIERWSAVHSAILGLWPFPSETTILIELLFLPLSSEKITYEEMVSAEAAAVALKNQSIYLPGGLNEHRTKIENILNSACQEYLKKKQVLEENIVENKDKLEFIMIIYHRLSKCLEEIEQVKIQEEKERKKKAPEKKVIKMQHPVELFIDKEALTLISLIRENEKKSVKYFLNDLRHLEMHIKYVRRCIEIINEPDGEENELKLWLNTHPMKKGEMLKFFKEMEDDLLYRLKDKLSCPHIPKEIREKIPIAICPVCGMDVDEKKKELEVEYEGIIYYFCCAHCKKVFEEEPARYHQIAQGEK